MTSMVKYIKTSETLHRSIDAGPSSFSFSPHFLPLSSNFRLDGLRVVLHNSVDPGKCPSAVADLSASQHLFFGS